MKPTHTMGKMILLTLINMLILLGAAKSFGLRLNVTESYPLGFYKVQPGDWHYNDLVELCLPDVIGQIALERDYLSKSALCNGVTPVIKKIVAVEGDTVNVTDVVSVNGQKIHNSNVRDRDPLGNKLTKATGETVGKHRAWVMSVHAPNSFDSRYFGAIDVSLIKHRLEPLWTL